MNYKKVISDARRGKLSKYAILIMENDGGYWQYTDPDMPDSDIDKKVQDLEKLYGEPGGYTDIINVLNSAGVKCEWC